MRNNHEHDEQEKKKEDQGSETEVCPNDQADDQVYTGRKRKTINRNAPTPQVPFKWLF